MKSYIERGLLAIAATALITSAGCKWYNPWTWGSDETPAPATQTSSAQGPTFYSPADKDSIHTYFGANNVILVRNGKKANEPLETAYPDFWQNMLIDNLRRKVVNGKATADSAFSLANIANTTADVAYGLARKTQTDVDSIARATSAINIANRRRINATNARIESLVAKSRADSIREASQDEQLGYFRRVFDTAASDARRYEGRGFPVDSTEADSTVTDSTKLTQ